MVTAFPNTGKFSRKHIVDIDHQARHVVPLSEPIDVGKVEKSKLRGKDTSTGRLSVVQNLRAGHSPRRSGHCGRSRYGQNPAGSLDLLLATSTTGETRSL
ncbi:hypothetical protein C8E89_1086 [Mycolicibacterium moriokaense]|uniref:Uncharacterized protein n=1 Tax=Mycolicibacterium moriokaense TaxID=39691 RepID=A0A318HFX1_9MYCO|nr:hypothetical protein C8E89_1086 [Mycolicibacterium moriokaense]